MTKKSILSLAVTSLISLASTGALAGESNGVPSHATVPLPDLERVLDEIEEEGDAVASELFSLQLYQDSGNDAHYYYVPVFRSAHDDASTASIVVNTRQVDRVDDLDRLSKRLIGGLDEYGDLLIRQRMLNERLDDLVMEGSENADEIAFLREHIDLLKAEIDAFAQKAKARESALPDFFRGDIYSRMSDVLGSAGIPTTGWDIKNTAQRSELLSRVAMSNGGMLSVNVKSGLTPKQLKAYKIYKKTRSSLGLPPIKVSLLPVEDLSWVSLAETVDAPAENAPDTLGVPLFRRLVGGGGFSGSTLVGDFTMAGAEAFAKSPPPLVMPLEAKGTLLVKYPAFVAHLKCEFTSGWFQKGRTDVRDGLIIYNNDLTERMISEDLSETEKPCTLTYEGGSGRDDVRESAHRLAMQRIQERLEDLYLERVKSSYRDRMDYWNAYQADLESNRPQRRGGGSIWNRIANFVTGGWSGIFGGLMSRAAGFYWHTDIRDVEHSSTFSFESKIVENGNTRIEVGLNTDICFAYNPAREIFVSCNSDELKNAVTPAEALSGIENDCEFARDVQACKDRRERQNPVDPETENIPPAEPIDEDELPSEL